MEDIINQIIQIDSVAFENSKKNEEFLIQKRQEYEKKISNYRLDKLALAKKNAELIYENIQANVEKEENVQKEKVKKVSMQIEKKYLQVEDELMQKIFNKLFVLEG